MTASEYNMIISTILVIVIFAWVGTEFLFWLARWLTTPLRRRK